MKRDLSALSPWIALAALAGCVRTISEAQCPCLDGWECCEEQNVCKLEGTCDPSPQLFGDASYSQGQDASKAGWDAAALGACDGASGSATRVCPGGPFSFAHLDTFAATRAALVGRWQVCEGTGFRWGPANASGIEFMSDGTFHLLGEDANGALRRLVGIHSTGGYKSSGFESDLNVYFNFPEGGGASFFPSFDAQKNFLHAGGDSGFDSNYARVAPDADSVPRVVIPAACGATVIDSGTTRDASARCDAAAPLTCPGGPFAFATLNSHAATRQAVVGQWELCEGQGFGWGPASARSGIEFTTDGRYYLLGTDAQGALSRMAGLHSTGSYDTGSTEQDPHIYLRFPEGGGTSFVPSFDTSRNHFYAGGSFEFNSTYVRVEPGAGGPVQAGPGSGAPAYCDEPHF